MEDFFEPNNIFISFRHDPVTYVLSKRQAVSRAFDKGRMEWRLALNNSQGTCRSTNA